MKIRFGTPADLSQAMAAGPLFHAEAPAMYRAMPLDNEKLEWSLARMIADKTFLVAQRDDGRLVGFVGAQRGEPFFSRAPLMLECFWWVYPEYRGTLCGPRLFRSLMKMSAGHWLILLTLEGENARGLQSFYERNEFELFERAYGKYIPA